ncbi:unnamed protein product [Trichobilharzia regenti]|nr:unnamed protein product [Trichobilharzia regenti]
MKSLAPVYIHQKEFIKNFKILQIYKLQIYLQEA